jgi:hypothetical protein
MLKQKLNVYNTTTAIALQLSLLDIATTKLA